MSREIVFIWIPLSIFHADVQTVTMETQQCLGNPVFCVTAAAMLTPQRPVTVTLSLENAWGALGTRTVPTVKGVLTGSTEMLWLLKIAVVSLCAVKSSSLLMVTWSLHPFTYRCQKVLSPWDNFILVVLVLMLGMDPRTKTFLLPYVRFISYSTRRSDGLEKMHSSIWGESGVLQSASTALRDWYEGRVML